MQLLNDQGQLLKNSKAVSLSIPWSIAYTVVQPIPNKFLRGVPHLACY